MVLKILDTSKSTPTLTHFVRINSQKASGSTKNTQKTEMQSDTASTKPKSKTSVMYHEVSEKAGNKKSSPQKQAGVKEEKSRSTFYDVEGLEETGKISDKEKGLNSFATKNRSHISGGRNILSKGFAFMNKRTDNTNPKNTKSILTKEFMDELNNFKGNITENDIDKLFLKHGIEVIIPEKPITISDIDVKWELYDDNTGKITDISDGKR